MKNFIFLLLTAILVFFSCSKEECPIVDKETDTLFIGDTIHLIDTLMLHDTIYSTDSILINDTILISYECDSTICRYNAICLDTSYYNAVNANELYYKWIFVGFINSNDCLIRTSPSNELRDPAIIFYENDSVSGNLVNNRYNGDYRIDLNKIHLVKLFFTLAPEDDWGKEFSYGINHVNPGYIKLEGNNLFIHSENQILVFEKE